MRQQPGEAYDSYPRTTLQECVTCLAVVLRACCCCPSSRRGYSSAASSEQSLLEARNAARLHLHHHQQQQLEAGIEATATSSPPRQTSATDRVALLPKDRSQPSDAMPASPPLKGLKHEASKASLAEDEDGCPTCLEAYTLDNPRVVAKCGHHYHLPCIYAWLERSPTCPMCGRKMEYDELT